jgi:hypothetical protein
MGVLPRMALIAVFPTQPISDFASLIHFALELEANPIAPNVWEWTSYSSGLPTVLSLLFRVSPFAAIPTARVATALLMGLTPLLPFWIWRGIYPLRTRLVAAGLLALWPGQILFSGVVAQDNWILPVAVALGALAVRSQVNGRGYGWQAGLLLGVGTAFRQEMLVPLFPLALAAALGHPKGAWRRPAAIMILGAGSLLGLVAVHRGLATGRYTVFSEHGAMAMLGSYAPGSGTNYWVDPTPFLAAEAPDLLESAGMSGSRAIGLAWHEVLKRPVFHVVRMVAGSLNGLIRTGYATLYWSLTGPAVVPDSKVEAARTLVVLLEPLLLWGPVAFWGAFLFLAVWSFHRGAAARMGVGVLVLAILLKILIHAVIGSQPRHFFVVVAWAMLAAAAGLDQLVRLGWSRRATFWLGGALLLAASLGPALGRAEQYLLSHDKNPPRAYSFPLRAGDLVFRCTMTEGRLVSILGGVMVAVLEDEEPAPGDRARADCRSTPVDHPASLRVEAYDGYEMGGYPGRILQVVTAQGENALEHDMGATSGQGWVVSRPIAIPAGQSVSLVLEIQAIKPDPGWEWGPASLTTFQLQVEPAEGPRTHRTDREVKRAIRGPRLTGAFLRRLGASEDAYDPC